MWYWYWIPVGLWLYTRVISICLCRVLDEIRRHPKTSPRPWNITGNKVQGDWKKRPNSLTSVRWFSFPCFSNGLVKFGKTMVKRGILTLTLTPPISACWLYSPVCRRTFPARNFFPRHGAKSYSRPVGVKFNVWSRIRKRREMMRERAAWWRGGIKSQTSNSRALYIAVKKGQREDTDYNFCKIAVKKGKVTFGGRSGQIQQ